MSDSKRSKVRRRKPGRSHRTPVFAPALPHQADLQYHSNRTSVNTYILTLRIFGRILVTRKNPVTQIIGEEEPPAKSSGFLLSQAVFESKANQLSTAVSTSLGK